MTNGREPTGGGTSLRAAAPASTADAPEATNPRAPGPRAVRVSLGPSMAVEGAQPVSIEPAPEPLAMLEASSGVGLLGGVTMDSSRGAPAHPSGVLVDGEPAEVGLRRLDAEHAILEVAGDAPRSVLLVAAPTSGPTGGTTREVVVDSWRIEVVLESAARAALRDRARRGGTESGRSGPTEVHAIIPGVVVGVSVVAGDEVVAGQQLLAIEAMKMQNELRAPRDGTVERVAVAVGQRIEVGDLLLVIA